MFSDAGLFILRCSSADSYHLWSIHTWLWLGVGLHPLFCRSHGSGTWVFTFISVPLKKKPSIAAESNSNFPTLLLPPLCPDPVVPHWWISALPHSLHLQGAIRQMVACYQSKCAAGGCAHSAGPALPQQPCLFSDTCSHRPDQRWEEEQIKAHTHRPQTAEKNPTRKMFPGDFFSELKPIFIHQKES